MAAIALLATLVGGPHLVFAQDAEEGPAGGPNEERAEPPPDAEPPAEADAAGEPDPETEERRELDASEALAEPGPVEADAPVEPEAESAPVDAEAEPAPLESEPTAPETLPLPAVAATSVSPDRESQSVPDPATVVLHVGHGLHVTSADGAFGLRLGLRGQLRPVLTVPSGGDAYFDFVIRRARVNFSGHLFDPANRFKIQLAFSPEDLGLDEDGNLTQTPLLDYIVEFRHLRDLEIVIGHYKRPFARERISSSGELSLVDRSIVDDALQLDRDLGFDVRSRDFLGLGWLRYYLGMSTGEGRDGGVGQDFGFLYFARLEILPLGLFDDHTQADLSRGAFPRLSLGFAYAFSDNSRFTEPLSGDANADGGTTDSHQGVFDLLFMWYGVTLEVDVIARYGVRTVGDARDDVGNLITPTLPSNGIGWFAQLSYLLPDVDLEIGGRVGINTPFGDATQTAFVGAGELGGGLGYYFEEHALSLHLDYFHLWTSDFERGDERVRLQLELIL